MRNSNVTNSPIRTVAPRLTPKFDSNPRGLSTLANGTANSGDSFVFTHSENAPLSVAQMRQHFTLIGGGQGPRSSAVRDSLGYELSKEIGIQGRAAYLAEDYHMTDEESRLPNLPAALTIMPSNTLFRADQNGVRLSGGGRAEGSLTRGSAGDIILQTQNNNRWAQSVFVPSEGGLTEQSTIFEYATASRTEDELRKETFILRRPDGTGLSYQQVFRHNGEERLVYDSETVKTDTGSLLTTRDSFDADQQVRERSITEANGPEQGVDFTNVIYAGTSATEILEQRSRATDSNGLVTELETIDRPNRTVQKIKITDADGNVSGRRVEVTPIANPKMDVEGIAMFGDNNPQRIMRRMGGRDNITATRVRQETYSNSGTIKTDSTVYQNADGTRELERIQSENGGLSWEYREQGEDGLVDSQLFFQGTKDTVVHNRSREGNMEVKRTTAHTPTLAKGNEGVPSLENTTLRRGENVTGDEVRRLFEEPALAGLQGTEAFQDFMGGLRAEQGLKVAFIDTEKTVDGKQQVFRSFAMTDADGRQLRGVYDQDGGAYSLQLQNPDGEVVKGGAAVESNGSVESRDYTREQLVSFQSSFEKVKSPLQPQHGPDAVANLLELDPVVKGAAYLFRSSPESVRSFGKSSGQLGSAIGGAMSALELADALRDGDLPGGKKALGTLATDIAGTGVRPSVPGANPIYRQGFRALGGAGLALQSMDVIQDLRDGRTTRAAAGGLGVAGTATALFSPLRLAGPIGFGLSAIGSAGVYAWDYNHENRVADLSSVF